MQSVTSNAVANALGGYIPNNLQYGGAGDRTNATNRANQVKHMVWDLKLSMFTLGYTGGYAYFYIANPYSGQEKSIIEINPYDAQISIFYINNAGAVQLQKTI